MRINETSNSVTVTYHRSYNYGASLQAYALQKTLYLLGNSNQILDFYRNPYEKLPLISGNLKIDIARLLIRLYGIKHRREKKILVNGFDGFTEKYLNLTKQYLSISELLNNPPEADFYLCGSDQVLTVREPDFVVKRNLLSFVNDDSKKYSYAASLAEYNLTNEEKQIMSKELSSFSVLSVREKSSIDYIKSFCDCNIRVDIDPVFLLNKEIWEHELIHPDYNKKYILYFQVNSNQIANSVIERIKNHFKLPVVCLQTNPHISVKADKVVLNASPEEFLGWIHDADFVITTSFHGTAFSILFERDFYVLTKPSSNPIRIFDLLDTFGLLNRMIDSFDKISFNDVIDWNQVNLEIENQKENSISYLNKIIKNDYII